MPVTSQDRAFSESAWDSKEFDWTGKTFYFVTIIRIFGKSIGLGGKLEELNREVRRHGYRTLNNNILIQLGAFKGRIMIEVEKEDRYDAQVVTYEEQTTVDTIVIHQSRTSLSAGVKRLKERVFSRRAMAPREIYYWDVNAPGGEDCIVLFGLT
mgnify:CR=1 FL=1